MKSAQILQIVFYFTGIISIMLGSYSLSMDRKSRLNQSFFAICMALSIWGIGFSMAIDASTRENCLFWRRFSAVGWGSMYAFLLHFCLIFSEKKELLKKWWLYLLIYAPAAIIIYIFAVSNIIAPNQYNLVRISAGWVNIAYNNSWDTFFNIYYTSYMIIGLSVVGFYGKRSGGNSVKQVKLMLYSYFSAFIIGSLTDIISSSILSIKTPQIAPIIILIPIITIYYSMTRYGFMNPKHVSEAEMILTHSTRAKVYENLSNALILGGFISYFVQYLYYNNFVNPILSSAFIMVLGILIRFIKSLKIIDNVKDIALIILIFISIPCITLIFIDFGGVTIWTISFLFIMISMVFNRPIVLISISVSIISTELLLWILKPEVHLVLDKVDYIGRIGMLSVTMGIAYYVNKVFIGRLKINADQLNIQRFISEVSSDLINVNQSNINEKMNWVLRVAGKLYSIDCINIVRVETEQKRIEYTNVYNLDNGDKGLQSSYEFQSEDIIPWLMNQMVSREYVHISDADTLEDYAPELRAWLKDENIHSFLAIPLIEKANSMMILQMISRNASKVWSDDELRALNIIANMFSDALMKVEVENEISFMAYHDHLTGLPNRRLLRDRINQAISLAKRTEKLLGIIFIDLDSFKSINDTVGHEGGDALLKIVSEKLTKTVRQSDTVSRFGGDEFVIMINHISNEDDIKCVTEKITEVLKLPVAVEGQEFNLTTSVGVSVYPFDGTDMDSLIRNADIAMYKAKENGKNQYVICTSELKSETVNKLKITNSLHRALERNEFNILYQPQINLRTGWIIGVEALLRWRHPELGFISPSVFIPIAEQIGAINEIGEWVLKSACIQNKKWQDDGYQPICMAVNVSVNQLRNAAFVKQVNQVLTETGLDPKYVEVEITESAAMNESGEIVDLMSDLRKLGITISIDDFGTQYSSLGRLKDLPIDKIKIDKKFIDGIEVSDKDDAIVRTIINLAKNLDLKVIAEGVEHENQMKFLKYELCDEVQGYYYFKPLPAQEIEKILNQDMK